jgi:mannonate dehydratase
MMKMGFRWYGEGNDSVTLEQIKQIPDTTEVVWALHHKAAGEVWTKDEIAVIEKQIKGAGLNMSVVESVNIHEDIKLGLPSRDAYIEAYIETLRNLAPFGVKVVCYNFMPVFDWARTNLFEPLDDGSTALFFEKAKITDVDPQELVKKIMDGSGDYTMPGWEPERLAHLTKLFELYKNVTEEDLFSNLKYFLSRICPVCEELDIKMAIHPDDPPFSIFGLPRIVTSRDNLKRLLELVPSKANGLTLCTGSLGANPDNNIPAIVGEFLDRIYFMHIRNVKIWPNGNFIETAHKTSYGSIDVTGIMKILHDRKFSYTVRPDHGRHIWGEKSRPGYGLYDRALGIAYLWGLYDAFERDNPVDK